MEIQTIVLSLAIILLVMTVLYYKGNSKLKQFISDVNVILTDDDYPLSERIVDAKGYCRKYKGLVPYAIYETLNSIEKSIKKSYDGNN